MKCMLPRPVMYLLVLLMMLTQSVFADESCGDLRNAYGPYDFWADKDKLDIVERAHFTSEVELLKKGKTGYLGGDIDYTLRAFPNHPRALMAMVRLGENTKNERPTGANFTVRCYLERATRFRPEDAMARMIYGTYLAKRQQNQQALEQLQVAEQYAGDKANVHYNLGLVYFDLKDYEKSLASAHKAYQLGFQLPGLRAKLEKAGKWRDPAPQANPADKPEEEQTQGRTN